MPAKRRHIDWSKWVITLVLCGVAYWGLQSCGCGPIHFHIMERHTHYPAGQAVTDPADSLMKGIEDVDKIKEH